MIVILLSYCACRLAMVVFVLFRWASVVRFHEYHFPPEVFKATLGVGASGVPRLQHQRGMKPVWTIVDLRLLQKKRWRIHLVLNVGHGWPWCFWSVELPVVSGSSWSCVRDSSCRACTLKTMPRQRLEGYVRWLVYACVFEQFFFIPVILKNAPLKDQIFEIDEAPPING